MGWANQQREVGSSPDRAKVDVVSLNTTALRGGMLLDDISSVFGMHAFLDDTSGGGASVAQQIRDALGTNLVRVIDLFREFDENGDGTVGKGEFRKALTRLMQSPPTREDSDALFESIDADESGAIEYKELHKLLRRRKGDRGPRQSLWEPRAARPKYVRPSSSSSAPAIVTDGDRDVPSGIADERRPVSPSALSFARSEAVLLGQLITRPVSTMALSRRRVATLNEMTASIDRTAEREAARIVALNRKQSQAEARVRALRSLSAKSRQAESIAATGVFVSRAALTPNGTTAGSTSELRAATPSNASTFGSAWWQIQSLQSTSWASSGRKPAVSLLDERFAPPRVLPSSISEATFRPVGNEHAAHTEPSRRVPDTVAAMATALLPYACVAVESEFHKGNSDGYESSLIKSGTASAIAAVPAAASRMEWQNDIGATPIRATLAPRAAAPHARAGCAPRQSATTPSVFMASLRSPSGQAVARVPVLPRPECNEAMRAGYWGGGFEVDRQSRVPGSQQHQQYFNPAKRALHEEQLAAGLTPGSDAAVEDADGSAAMHDDLLGFAAKPPEASANGRTLAQKFLEKRFGKAGSEEIEQQPPPPRPTRAAREDPILLPRRVVARGRRGA